MPIDTDDIGTEIGEQHTGIRRRPDTGDRIVMVTNAIHTRRHDIIKTSVSATVILVYLTKRKVMRSDSPMASYLLRSKVGSGALPEP